MSLASWRLPVKMKARKKSLDEGFQKVDLKSKGIANLEMNPRADWFM